MCESDLSDIIMYQRVGMCRVEVNFGFRFQGWAPESVLRFLAILWHREGKVIARQSTCSRESLLSNKGRPSRARNPWTNSFIHEGSESPLQVPLIH